MVSDALAACETMRDLGDLAFGVAEHEKVGLGIQQHAAPDLLRPVVEVRNSAQARLDAADHDRHVLERFAEPIAVHDDALRSGRALALPSRRVGVIGPYLFGRPCTDLPSNPCSHR